ncbi:MAG: T9SS type A sorting domain-containing protein [Paludibacter sp.]|jgi:hypothetical protein|nr:T9SS type A sorting domain-containing protein [Paludibacter sp.]
MKTIVAFLIVLFSLAQLSAQTVVRMRMPEQAEQALEVITLFSDGLPTGFPIVLGTLGFDVNGGTAPLTFEWMKNNTVIATGDIAVITPVAGSTYSLRVSDKAGCYFEEVLRIDTQSKAGSEYIESLFKVSPTIVANELTVESNSFFPIQARIRVYNTSGLLMLDNEFAGSFQANMNWPDGIYFVVISAGGHHKVTKISVKK